MDQQYSLKWNNYFDQITSSFVFLRDEESLVDVTLSCEGRKIKAHKLLLSACSMYFRDIFKDNPCQHPIIVFKNVGYGDLKAIIDFIYNGEVSVSHEQFESFLSTAEMLEVKGLTNAEERECIVDRADKNETSLEKQISMDSRNSRAGSSPRRSESPAPRKRKCTERIETKITDKKQKSISDEILKSSIEPKVETGEFVEDLTVEDDDQISFTDLEGKSEPIDSVGLKAKESASNEETSVLTSDQEFPVELATTLDSHVLQEPMTTGSSQNKEGTHEDNANKNDGPKVADTVSDNGAEASTDDTSLKPAPITVPKSDSGSAPVVDNAVAAKLVSVVKLCDKEKDEFSKVDTRTREATGKSATNPKTDVHFPKGLVVTLKSGSMEQILESKKESFHPVIIQTSEDPTSCRSEEAKTPIQEESIAYQSFSGQSNEINESSTITQIVQNEPETAEEAPEMVVEAETPQEEEKEPEFDYFGCEICKEQAKPVDLLNIVLSHRCPICPCVCFCSHLLKEHMKVIHGWFKTQRSFVHY